MSETSEAARLKMVDCPKCGRRTFDPNVCQREPAVAVDDLVTWTMPRKDARHLLAWLRHNRPLGMPDQTFDGLVDALTTPARPASPQPPASGEGGGAG